MEGRNKEDGENRPHKKVPVRPVGRGGVFHRTKKLTANGVMEKDEFLRPTIYRGGGSTVNYHLSSLKNRKGGKNHIAQRAVGGTQKKGTPGRRAWGNSLN